jgi:hypothetical protein
MATNPEKTNYWLQQIEALKSSGLTQRAYCEKYQIKLSTLGYWCQKLNRSKKEFKKSNQSGWIPIQISEEGSSGIELRVGRIAIAIKPGFDPALLTELLRTIGAQC